MKSFLCTKISLPEENTLCESRFNLICSQKKIFSIAIVVISGGHLFITLMTLSNEGTVSQFIRKSVPLLIHPITHSFDNARKRYANLKLSDMSGIYLIRHLIKSGIPIASACVQPFLQHGFLYKIKENITKNYPVFFSGFLTPK